MGTFSIWHWIVVLIIVVLVFGTKKLRNLGGDLGSAIKGFKEGMKDANSENNTPPQSSTPDSLTFDDDISNPAHSLKEAIKSQETAAASETTSTANDTKTTLNAKEDNEQKPDSSNQTTNSTSGKNTQSKT